MNLLRLLLIAAVVLIAYRLISASLQRRRERRVETPAPPRAVRESVRCQHCGLNIDRTEALYRDDRPYCCPEHRDGGKA